MADITVFYEGPIVTRAEARALGLIHYFTGTLCKRGHVAERLTCNGGCGHCHRIKCRERNNKNKIQAAAKAAENRKLPGAKAKQRAYFVAHYEANRAIYISRAKAHYQNLPPEKKREKIQKARAWKLTPQGQATAKASAHRRRARKAASPGRMSASDILKLFEHQDRCYICGRRFTTRRPPTLDHVIPLSKGGPDIPSNVALACLSCNSRKAASLIYLL